MLSFLRNFHKKLEGKNIDDKALGHRSVRKEIKRNHKISNLLSDTEILKDVAQYLIGGDFAGDFTQVVKGFADVL